MYVRTCRCMHKCVCGQYSMCFAYNGQGYVVTYGKYVVFAWPVQFSMCFAWGWQSYVVTYGMWFSVGPCNFQCVLHAIGRSMLRPMLCGFCVAHRFRIIQVVGSFVRLIAYISFFNLKLISNGLSTINFRSKTI